MSSWGQRRGGDREIERHVRQIRELVRLSNTLHADLGLAEILTQLANAVSSTIGFKSAVFNLVRPDSEYLEVAAAVGISPAEYQRLCDSPPPLQRVLRAMRPEFCRSRSYYISHQFIYLLDGIETLSVAPPPAAGAPRPTDAWHPDDMLLVPLVSSRQEQLLGILSLDQPEDGKIPDLETIEVVELFANQAAVAIDMARLFEERERERKSLEEGLYTLLYQMGEIGPGTLAIRPEAGDVALNPIGESLSAAVTRLGSLLGEVRQASEVVNRSAAEVRAAATSLAQGAQHQTQQILEVSSAVAGVAAGVQHIAGTADSASAVSREATEVSHQGREAAERAVAGMAGVREMTLQSARKVKRLGESTQEVGEIVQMVSGFAKQTNLLALNAAIEAARAGEHGRGFSIVAQEIRNLANSSADATQAIHARIKAIQNDTSAVVVTIEESTRQVVIQSEMVTQAGAALEAVDAVMQRIAEGIGDITQTAGQQAQASTMIANSMDDIARITAQTRDSMEQMHAAMEHLAELADSLTRSISVFHLGPSFDGEVTGHLAVGSDGDELNWDSGYLLAEPGGDGAITEPMSAVYPRRDRTYGSLPSGIRPAGFHQGTPSSAEWGAPGAVSYTGGPVPFQTDQSGPLMGVGGYPQALSQHPATIPLPESDIPPPPPGFEDWENR